MAKEDSVGTLVWHKIPFLKIGFSVLRKSC